MLLLLHALLIADILTKLIRSRQTDSGKTFHHNEHTRLENTPDKKYVQISPTKNLAQKFLYFSQIHNKLSTTYDASHYTNNHTAWIFRSIILDRYLVDALLKKYVYFLHL